MAAVGPVRPGRVQRGLLRRAGAGVLARPTRRRPGDPGPRRFPGGRQDLPVLRAVPLAGAHAVHARGRPVRRAVGAPVDADRRRGALSVVGTAGSRRACGGPAHVGCRRQVGAGPLHGGGGVLAGAVRCRLDLGLQRDGAVGVDARGDRVRPDRRMGGIRFHRPPPAARRGRGCALGDADPGTDRARRLARPHRVRCRAVVAQPTDGVRSRTLGSGRWRAPHRRTCRRQLREVRDVDLDTGGSTVAVVDRP